MLKKKPEELFLQAKSLSPRSGTNGIHQNSPKLPNITNTLKLSKRYFQTPRESPMEMITKPFPRQTVMEIPSPTESKQKFFSRRYADEHSQEKKGKYIQEGLITNTNLEKRGSAKVFQDDSSPLIEFKKPLTKSPQENFPPVEFRRQPEKEMDSFVDLIHIEDQLSEEMSQINDEQVLEQWKSEIEILKKELNKTTTTLNNYKTVLSSIEEMNFSQEIFLQLSANDTSSVEKETEHVRLITETIKNLQNELVKSQETVKLKESKEKAMQSSYNQEIQSLTMENLNLKGYVQKLSKKVEKLKSFKCKTKNEIEDMKNVTKSSLIRSDETLTELVEELQLKHIEIEQLKELVSRSDLQKKRLTENIRESENEITTLSKEFKRVDFCHETLKQKHQQLTEEFQRTDEKAKLYEETREKLENQKSLASRLEVDLFEKSEEVKKLNIKIDSLKYIVEMQRQQIMHKEASYQATVQEFFEKMEGERVISEVRYNESVKLKRALTLKESDDGVSVFSRDELQRYITRLQQSEEENANYLIEIEKLKKTQEYYKDVIKCKNEMISKLEGERTEVIEVEEKGIIDAISEVRSQLTCRKCQSRKGAVFVAPCHHVFCKVCLCESELCPVCSRCYTYISPVSYFETVNAMISYLDKLIYR